MYFWIIGIRKAGITPMAKRNLHPSAGISAKASLPTDYLDEFARLELFVLLEEMLDLLFRKIRQLIHVLDAGVVRINRSGRSCDYLRIRSLLILRQKHAYRP